MDKPEKLIVSDESFFREGYIGVIAGIAILIFAGMISLTQSEVKFTDLVLPIAGISAFWLLWMVVHAIIGLTHQLITKRDINRLFGREIWQRWQFHSDEWQDIVETEYQTMCPEGGAGAYVGAVYSTIVGLVISAIMVGVVKIFIKDEQLMPIILICALVVLVLFFSVGLFQPISDRYKARRYKQKALRVLAPRVWFGAEGVYHEAYGYTSLKGLEDVNDHTRKLRTIKFTIKVSTILGSVDSSSESIHYQPVSFSVPSGYERQAAQLVYRYRRERLRG